MSGQTVSLTSPANRDLAKRLVHMAPFGSVVNIRKATRTKDQNDKMWALISDIARAKPEKRDYDTDTWKVLFMALAGFKFRWEPGLDGEGVVPVGFRSSRLTKEQMSDLITCIEEYGDRHGVDWTIKG